VFGYAPSFFILNFGFRKAVVDDVPKYTDVAYTKVPSMQEKQNYDAMRLSMIRMNGHLKMKSNHPKRRR
jgi:hypothetical protein